MMDFGTILKQIREAKGLTQEEVARQLGYKTNWLCRIEKGQRKLKAQTLIELCKIYGVKPDKVLKLAENTSPRSQAG